MNAVTNTPQFFYHYTNVDSLALILKNKSIRLNSLDKMDDLQEQMSTDKQNFGKFVFVSSWTADSTESIPMWRMYTPKQRGVRIKLPANPFVEYGLNAKEVANLINAKFNGDPSSAAGFKTIVPTEVIVNGEFSILNYSVGSILYEVKYTDDDALLKPTILKIVNNKFAITLSDIGIYKNTYWSFQKEWRYRLMILPISSQKMIQEQFQGRNDEMAKLQFKTIAGQAALPFDHFDLIIRDDCLNDMGITLAPDISESATTFVELMVKEYNPSCKIEKSVLTNLLQ